MMYSSIFLIYIYIRTVLLYIIFNQEYYNQEFILSKDIDELYTKF